MKYSLGASLFAFGILFNTALNATESLADSSFLDNADLTVASESDDEERWSSFLPLWSGLADKVGADLPLPIGISVVYIGLDVPISITGGELFVNDGSILNIDGEYITPDNTEVDNLSIMVDALVLPFLNLSLTYGPTSGTAPVRIDVPSSELPIGLGQVLAAATPGENVVLEESLSFSGSTASLGVAFLAGYPMESGTFLAAADVKYMYTNLDILSSTIEARLYTYRVGWDSYYNGNRYQVFTGAMKHNATQVGGVPISGLDLPILRNLRAEIGVADPAGYTPFVGGGYSFTENWMVMFEKRFGGRDLTNLMLTYRF